MKGRRRFGETAFAIPPKTPALLRPGVDVLLQGDEPVAFLDGLDPLVPETESSQ